MEKCFISNLSTEEHEILHQILIRCSTKISNFLIQHQDPKKYVKFIANHIGKKKFILSVKLFSELSDMDKDKPYTRNEIKDVIQSTNIHVARKIISSEYITESSLSKTLGEFRHKGLLLNITSKSEIKNIRTKEFMKTKEKKSYKTEGRISFYKKALNIDRVVEVISKPGIIEYIIDTLSKFDNGLIDKYLKFSLMSFIYLLPHQNDILEFYAKSLSNYYKNIQLDFNTFDKFKSALSSLPEPQIEIIAEKYVELFKKKFGSSILIYILSVIE